MYLPKSFELTNPIEIHRVLHEFSFATLVTSDEDGLQSSHLPFEFDAKQNVLISHMARANPQWREFNNLTSDALIIFQGPHGYISPRWYQTELAVPTWNYVVVHVYGKPKIIEDDEQVADLLERLVAVNEAQFETPWKLEAPAEWHATLRGAIVGFEIHIEKIEAKAKMSQNRPASDVERVIAGLEERNGMALANWMRRQQKGVG